jgi:hypothetical protein
MEVELQGLEHDNLLGILAAVGCLRALDHAQPGWQPKLKWNGTTAALQLSAHASTSEIAAAVDAGVVALGVAYGVLPGDDPKWHRDEWRDIVRRGADPAVMAAIGSEVLGTAQVKKAKEGKERKALVAAHCSPVIMLNGGKHMHFLPHLRELVAQTPSLQIAKDKTKVRTYRGAERIEAALFGRWQRVDNGRGRTLRWDWAEIRDHASRWSDPNSEPVMPVEIGAYRMAAVGWVVYRCGVRGRRLVTAACAADPKGWRIRWPLWSLPLSWQAVWRLWPHPALVDGELPGCATTVVMECRRVNEDNGGVGSVTRAHVAASAPVRTATDR